MPKRTTAQPRRLFDLGRRGRVALSPWRDGGSIGLVIPDAEPRAIRVFVSSTFRDMQAEREELVKQIFPRLRNLCEERAVTWGEVDLRWGVTEEQSAEGQALPICLAGIRGCRPYFIGLLCARSGWVPAE